MVVRLKICAQSVDIRTTLSWLRIEPCNAACGEGANDVRLRWSRGPTQKSIVEGERRWRCRRGLRTSCTIGQGPGCADERCQCFTIEVVIQAVEQSRSHNMRVTVAVDLGYQQGISQPDTPRRKLLFVPGDSASKLLSFLLAFSGLFVCPFPHHVQPDATARTKTSIKQVRKQATNQNKHER
ncbi:unnamed protein product [Sphagnum troendelagicum]|uniref:Uncharacterized protein n=1 Tax=Sphagnum troendelagicum TaxID=128251 RepID=A0ABP0TXL8_9BRYO